MDPLTLLPPGMTLEYLRRLVNLDPTWNVIVVYDTAMDPTFAAQVDWDHATKSAMICVNGTCTFSGPALAKAITHELLELATVDTWLIFKQARRPELEQSYRDARDRQIEQRLSAMPFWENDIPQWSA